jgi:LuxR family transcriptional regulator, maltose regulon positive regulatory protein
MTTAAVAEPLPRAMRMWSTRPPREGAVVRRPGLVRRLADPEAPPLAVIVAPAGYGKTTLLREWESRDARPFAWVTVDERGGLHDAIEATVDGDAERGFVVVVDDAHALCGGPGLDALAAVADVLPPNATLAVASRRRLPLPVARLRAQGLVTEIGPRDLAMTRSEAARLLAEAGHRLDHDALDLLLHRTEGWPVALALAALYLGERGGRPNLERFDGCDRLVADYVRDEVLGDLPADALSFAVRTCVAETLTSSLCDALTDRGDSGWMLETLACEGLLIPVDRTGERYRYHRLVRDTLGAELRREPELACDLHRRASAWHRSVDDVDRAVHHSLAAGDVRVAADLVWGNAAARIADGQAVAVERWVNMFSESEIARRPRLALVAAGCELARGQGHRVDRWATAARDAPQPAGSTGDVQAGVALMRAATAAGGPARMRADAHAAAELLRPPGGPAQALACLLEGVADHLLGDRARAMRRLAEGARHAAVTAPLVHALCLSQLAALALERADWEEMGELSARARGQVEHHGLRNTPTSALVFAIAALARARRGRIEDARADAQHAASLLAMTTDFAAWYGAEVRILLARAALRYSDVRLARAHVNEAARRLRHVPEAVALTDWLAQTEAQLEAFTPPESAQPATMTAAELRVLRYLPTHLSFREIAERTHVSANTVKTQANAVYRKFGVACRSDAVTRARSCGLLE